MTTFTLLLLAALSFVFWPPTTCGAFSITMSSSVQGRSSRTRSRVPADPDHTSPRTVRSTGSAAGRGSGGGRNGTGRGTKTASRTPRRRSSTNGKTSGSKNDRCRGIQCTCVMCGKDWIPGAPWGDTITSSHDGAVVQEAVGDFCHKCAPVGSSFALDPQDLAACSDADEVAPKLAEAYARSCGEIAPLREKEGVSKADVLQFSGGRHVMLLNAAEICKLANRESLPNYAVEGVPVVSMRKEKDPNEWEDVYVFPDPERPGRRGWIGQSQDLSLKTNVMPESVHLWQGQGSMFYRKALEEHMEDTGTPEAITKAAHNVKTVEDVLERMRKPGTGEDVASVVAKHGSKALPLGGGDSQNSTGRMANTASTIDKSLGLFGVSPAKTQRIASPEPSPVRKKGKGNDQDSAMEKAAPSEDDGLEAPGSPGGMSSLTSASSNLLELVLGDDKGELYLKKWKQSCPENFVLIDEVDGRRIEGLTRASQRLKKVAEKDPLKKTSSNELETFCMRVKHCQKYSVNKFQAFTRDEVHSAVAKIIGWGPPPVQIAPQYHLALLSMEVKREVQETSTNLSALKRLIPLSNGRALNPLDVNLGGIDCAMEDKTVLFQNLVGKSILANLIHQGNTTSLLVSKASTMMLEEFGKVDVVEAEASLTACKTTAEQVASCLNSLYKGSIDPANIDHVLAIDAKGKAEPGDGSMQHLVGKAVLENEWWNQRLEQYKRVVKTIENSGDSVIDFAASVASMVDKSQLSTDDMKIIQEAAKLMGSIGTKLPMGNEEASYLGNAIPSVLRKAYSKITQDNSKSNQTNESNANYLAAFERAITAARESYPESQELVWVEHSLEELRAELTAHGDWEKLKAKIEVVEKLQPSSIDAVMLAEFDELINPCLAFDFSQNQGATIVLTSFMSWLLSNAFYDGDGATALVYLLRNNVISMAGKFSALCKKAGAPHFEVLVGGARAIKSLADVLQNEDSKDVQQLYNEGQANKFSLCKKLSAEIKKLNLTMKAIGDKAADDIANYMAAANNFEARAQQVVSSVYSRRQESLQQSLDAAVSTLSAKVYFGDAETKRKWDHELPKNAKHDVIFAKASETCLKTPADELDQLITALQQAWLIRPK